LVKKLRRRQISSHEAANVYLRNEYLPEHNERFARGAAKPEDYHRPAPRRAELERIFRLENERSIGNDAVVRYRGRFYQLEGGKAPAQAKVLVCEGRFGRITIEYRGRELRFAEIAAPARPGIEAVKRSKQQQRAMRAGVRRAPAANHPWKEGSSARRSATERAASGGASAGDVDPALRFALNAPPFGLRRAARRAGSTRNTNTKPNITTNSKRGTLLIW
jgi:hypothetical protein